ncbi:MAG: sortase [Acidimicrobiia bacterium]
MANGHPRTGTHLATYERVVDLGIFDGRMNDLDIPVATEIPGDQQASRRRMPGWVSRPLHYARFGSARSIGAEDARAARPPTPTTKSPRGPLAVGILLVAVGIAAVSYGVYGLFITNLITAGEQVELSEQFDERQRLAAAGDDATLYGEADAANPDDFGAGDVPIFGTPDDGFGDPNIDIPGVAPERAPPQGDALGRISAPKIGLDWVVVEGVGVPDLRKGPGHMPGTPMPGQYGNSVISGHRTTYGGPFNRIDELDPGDRITVETLIGTHTYEVVSSEIVGPTHTWVVKHRDGAWLTLTTCHPKLSSQQRLIVFAKLIGGPNAEPIEEYYGTNYPPPVAPDGTPPVPVFVPPTTTTTTLPEPFNVAGVRHGSASPGDILVAQVTAQGGSGAGISPPAGWRLAKRDDVGTDLAQAVFWKVAGPSEPASFNFWVTGSTGARAAVVGVPGDPDDPIAGVTGATGVGSSLTAPGAGSGAGTQVSMFSILSDGSLSTPGETTQVTTSQANGVLLLMANGSGGSKSSSASKAGPWIAQSIFVRAAPPEETTTTTTTTVPPTTTTEETTTTTITTTTTTTEATTVP